MNILGRRARITFRHQVQHVRAVAERPAQDLFLANSRKIQASACQNLAKNADKLTCRLFVDANLNFFDHASEESSTRAVTTAGSFVIRVDTARPRVVAEPGDNLRCHRLRNKPSVRRRLHLRFSDRYGLRERSGNEMAAGSRRAERYCADRPVDEQIATQRRGLRINTLQPAVGVNRAEVRFPVAPLRGYRQ